MTGAGTAASAKVELYAMELEGYGPFRWLTKIMLDCITHFHSRFLLQVIPEHGSLGNFMSLRGYRAFQALLLASCKSCKEVF